ncbi:hypothetical protein GGF41_002948, partial [Coemansia sp. RSA 2531]
MDSNTSTSAHPHHEHLPQQVIDNLAKKIERRPTREELENHHVLLKTNVAPALQAKQVELERNRLEDRLEHMLENRPTREELVDHNVLKSTTVAPALQAKQVELERNRLHDTLDVKLER